jgi:molybdopterin molybdotransferase
MISVETAQKLIERNCCPLKTVAVPAAQALRCVLAQDLRAPFDLPIADNSAMDGFVLRSRDTLASSNGGSVGLVIRGSIRAGDSQLPTLRQGEAYRIMTGACVPKGGDTVLPKELAEIEGNRLVIRKAIPAGRHVRCRGEEVKKGEVVIAKHSKINPATIGVIATLGIRRVNVFKKPSVSLVATGSELVQPGSTLKRGQIYDSNSSMITSALHEMGMAPVHVIRAGDDLRTLKKAIQKAIATSDVIILMGGVSVGDYDFVKKIVEDHGVEKIFWRVSQKPGKPLYFGKKGQKLVFGLPGNPASVYTCFYQHVYPALRRMSGSSDPYLRRARALVVQDIKADTKRLSFLKARTSWKRNVSHVKPLGRQGSHMISSLHTADSFILVPPMKGTIKKGQHVDIDLLPRESER